MAEVKMDPVLLLISAPSGGGKTTVMNGLLATCPNLRRVITCTTRNPRPGETDGVHYHFLSKEEFQRRRELGEFLEWAEVYGRAYGTLRSGVYSMLDAGQDVILSLDVQGAATVRRLAESDARLRKHLCSVFITPPSARELESRLRGRGSEAEEDVARRLAMADIEVAQWRSFDYLVVSDSREADLLRIRSIYEAERNRAIRQHFDWNP